MRGFFNAFRPVRGSHQEDLDPLREEQDEDILIDQERSDDN